MDDKILKLLCDKVRSSEGVKVFVRKPAKFEQWIQVELCGLLSIWGLNPLPEKKLKDSTKAIDIVFDSEVPGKKDACEIKVIFRETSGWEYSKKGDNACNSLDSLEEDVQKLNLDSVKNEYANRWVIFVVVGSPDNVSQNKGGHIDWKTKNLNKRFQDIQSQMTEINENVFKLAGQKSGLVVKVFLGKVDLRG